MTPEVEKFVRIGYFSPEQGLIWRACLWVLSLFLKDHVWTSYMRGLCAFRVRCRRCGVTVSEDEADELRLDCSDVIGLSVIEEVMDA